MVSFVLPNRIATSIPALEFRCIGNILSREKKIKNKRMWRSKIAYVLSLHEVAELDDEYVDRKAMAKLMTARSISIEVLKASIVKAWAISGGVECKTMGNNIFVFKFQKSSDMIRVLGNNLLLLCPYDSSKRLEDYSFDRLPIWKPIFGMSEASDC
ncbi:hypothetical protein Droror1_Dr00025079 [Drosera rotundifolia]